VYAAVRCSAASYQQAAGKMKAPAAPAYHQSTGFIVSFVQKGQCPKFSLFGYPFFMFQQRPSPVHVNVKAIDGTAKFEVGPLQLA
jgi:hypothetical protein